MGVRFLLEHAECSPRGRVPDDPGQLVIVAVKVYELFLPSYHETASGRHYLMPNCRYVSSSVHC